MAFNVFLAYIIYSSPKAGILDETLAYLLSLLLPPTTTLLNKLCYLTATAHSICLQQRRKDARYILLLLLLTLTAAT